MLTLILKILPSVLAAIVAAEQSHADGRTKRATAIATASAALGALGVSQGTIDHPETVETMGHLIDTAISLTNGIAEKEPPKPNADPAPASTAPEPGVIL